MKNCWT